MQIDSCQRGGGLQGWVRKVKGLSNKNNSDTDHSMVITKRERGLAGGRRGSTVVEGELTWNGEHTVQYTDDLLQHCTLKPI